MIYFEKMVIWIIEFFIRENQLNENLPLLINKNGINMLYDDTEDYIDTNGNSWGRHCYKDKTIKYRFYNLHCPICGKENKNYKILKGDNIYRYVRCNFLIPHDDCLKKYKYNPLIRLKLIYTLLLSISFKKFFKFLLSGILFNILYGLLL